MTYPGGKNATFRHILNQIPPHDVFIETHGGSGAVIRNKLPARVADYYVEISPKVFAAAQPLLPARACAVNGDCERFLADYFKAASGNLVSVVYADPPYLFSTRKSQRELYEYEFGTTAQHLRLITALSCLPALVLISGYRSELYDQLLHGWRRVEFVGYDRQGRARTECLWCNFPEPVELHDWRWLGENKMERQRIKRKKERFKRKLLAMSPLERAAVLSAVRELTAPGRAVAIGCDTGAVKTGFLSSRPDLITVDGSQS